MLLFVAVFMECTRVDCLPELLAAVELVFRVAGELSCWVQLGLCFGLWASWAAGFSWACAHVQAFHGAQPGHCVEGFKFNPGQKRMLALMHDSDKHCWGSAAPAVLVATTGVVSPELG